jgi:hypothetical protein
MDMSFRTVQRFGFVSALALASVFAAACGDDEDKETGGDGDGDAPSDAGTKMDASTLGPLQVMCGTNVCDGVDLTLGSDLKGCCLEGDVCGVASDRLEGAGKPACVVRDAPGVASVGEGSCTAVWDQVDFGAENGTKADAGPADNKMDGKFTTPAMGPTIVANFDGCCTAAGTCSIDFKAVAVVANGMSIGAPTNVGYGCPDPAYVGLAEASAPAGFGETIGCDPATGAVNEQPVAPMP